MANFLYVDHSNVWIEGMHVAAVASGLAPDVWTSQQGNVCDYTWTFDFGRLAKKVDTSIATDATADSYELMDPEKDEITLVAGDADYVPTIDRLRKLGFQFYVYFRDCASKEIRQAASNFTSLNPYLRHLRDETARPRATAGDKPGGAHDLQKDGLFRTIVAVDRFPMSFRRGRSGTTGESGTTGSLDARPQTA